MATRKAQRYGIMVILIVLVVGTIGSFAVMILGTKSDNKDAARYQEALNEYNKVSKEYQDKVNAQGDELSVKYYPSFSGYSDTPSKFDMKSVDSLSTEDIVVGTGSEITGTTGFAAYYIGWDANGRVFDQSIDTANKKLKAPLPIDTGLDSASLIEGWKVGMKGMKIGGVRVITIPSDQAYGEQGSTDQSGQQTIAPNMPLKFIVMAIPKPEPIAQPDTTDLIKTLQETSR